LFVVAPVLTILVLGGASHALYRPGAPCHISERTGIEERHHGMALFDAARYDEAAHAYRRSLAIQEDPITRNNLANALKAGGHIDAAAEQYRVSLRLNPRDAITWYNYGILQFRDRKDLAEAERAYGEAIRHAPLMPEPHLKLGELYLSTGRTDDAAREIERCLELAPPGAAIRPRAERLLELARSGPVRR
jgi:tetratricopeptide (TPR) repeat protein